MHNSSRFLQFFGTMILNSRIILRWTPRKGSVWFARWRRGRSRAVSCTTCASATAAICKRQQRPGFGRREASAAISTWMSVAHYAGRRVGWQRSRFELLDSAEGTDLELQDVQGHVVHLPRGPRRRAARRHATLRHSGRATAAHTTVTVQLVQGATKDGIY